MKISVDGEIVKTEDDDSTTRDGENYSSLSIEGRSRPRGSNMKLNKKITQKEYKRREERDEQQRLPAALNKDKQGGRLLKNAKLDQEGLFHFDPRR